MMDIEQCMVELSRRVRALLNEEQTDVTDRFTIKKKGHDSYCLRETGNNYRARWGNLEQIMEDAEHVLRYKVLPMPEKAQGW